MIGPCSLIPEKWKTKNCFGLKGGRPGCDGQDLQNMSARASQMLKEDMEFMGPVVQSGRSSAKNCQSYSQVEEAVMDSQEEVQMNHLLRTYFKSVSVKCILRNFRSASYHSSELQDISHPILKLW